MGQSAVCTDEFSVCDRRCVEFLLSWCQRGARSTIVEPRQHFFNAVLFSCGEYIKGVRTPEKNNSISRFSKCPKTTFVYVKVTKPSSSWRKYEQRKSGDVIIERHSLCREAAGGVDGCLNKMSDSCSCFLPTLNVGFFYPWLPNLKDIMSRIFLKNNV